MTEIKPIRCLAIVNRGEAAMRCIRAVKSLRALEGKSLTVVALYTYVDRDAPFVRHADVAVELPVKTTPVAAYLDHELLISTLKRVGADAAWPGWGFVAESPEFVDKLRDAGIRFLGPSASTMRQLGDKIQSKIVAEEADVPVTAWSEGAVELDEARVHADRIGYPVVIKASAGGGGRGIRVVRDPDTFSDLFRSAQSEALSAFGDGRMFVEAMVQGGRHIEVQIIADDHGHVIALGCRDCSVQRRHQKLLEEAPPVGLPDLMFRALKDSAVALAKSVSYSGAGTVEFLVDGADFFFLEMNPRLQVEHGITEQITGADLVQMQIRVGRGERLPDEEFRERGFAIEARVCAEDPDAGFLPAPGRIARFDPALGPDLRVDTGVAAESSVPAAFDSLIAKVIARGNTREEARVKLTCALRDFDLVIEGGATNKGYLIEVLETDAFREGGVNTTWLDRWNETRARTGRYAAEALMLAAVLSYQAARSAARASFYLNSNDITQDEIPASAGLEFDLAYAGQGYRAQVFASGAARYRVHVNGRVVPVRLAVSGAHAARMVVGDQDLRVLYDVTDSSIRVEVEGTVHQFGRQTAGQVRANAPSMMVALNVSVGDRLNAGDSLGLLEAMKMEIGFDAPVSGTVTEIRVSKGQQLAAGDVILVIDPESDDAANSDKAESIELPQVSDPLSLFFGRNEKGELAEPELAAAAIAKDEQRRGAMSAVTDEIRRIVLGYDAFEPRVKLLIQFLRAPLPESLPAEFTVQLSQVASQLRVFADVERIFQRSMREGLGTGELSQYSNNALTRLFVRRMRADGEGLPAGFLEVMKTALSHYDDRPGLKHSSVLERAVLRMFASQQESALRRELVSAVLHRVVALAEVNPSLERDHELRETLRSIAAMREQVSNAIADLAVDASYLIFQRPQLDRVAEATTRQVETWLASPDSDLASAPELADLALAPRRRFRRVLAWLCDSEPRRKAIALSATVRRAYAPNVPKEVWLGGGGVEHLRFDTAGVIVAGVTSLSEFDETLAKLRSAAEGANAFGIELCVPVAGPAEKETVLKKLKKLAGTQLGANRLTVSLLDGDYRLHHETYLAATEGAKFQELYGIHPEAAERIGLSRYQSFELERLEAAEDVYCFFGRSLDVPDDQRVFVLGDVRGRPRGDDSDFQQHVPIFERLFFEAARSMRGILTIRDPRRRMRWNRITLFVAQPLQATRGQAEQLLTRLNPATDHLGLERVTVRFTFLSPGPDTPEGEQELLLSAGAGNRAEISWREPHTDPLVPVAAYERSVVAARRRGLVYPYEVIRMLAPGEESPTPDIPDGLPPGQFEEYDLDPSAESPVAKSVAGRAPGQNSSAVVFGVITTPTRKVPEGMGRVLILSDPTRGMGALSAPECDRVVAAINLAESLKVPVEWLPVSSGARISMDSGTENLDATARVVRRIVTFTQAGGVIHLIITGVNVGAQSYWDSLATMLNHTRGALIMTPGASMVLTGRAALAASGSVSAEDEVAIAGYERVMGPNGQAHFYADDLNDAYRLLYQHYEFTYVVAGETRPRTLRVEDPVTRNLCDASYNEPGFETVGEVFDQASNPGRKKPFAMRALMGALTDVGEAHLERWQAHVGAETAIVWDAHVGGHPVCLLGIESQNVTRWGYRPLDGPAEWNGGTLFPMSSKKVARALNAASGNRPCVILANLSGFDGSPESMRELQLEYGAEIARAVVNFDGPLVFLVVSRYHGGAYVVFSRELNPGLRAYAVEGSYASVIGGGPAAAVVFPREVSARVSKDPRVMELRREVARGATPERRAEVGKLVEETRLEKQGEVAAEFDRVHSVERAKEVGSLEGIIPASQIRSFIIGCLQH